MPRQVYPRPGQMLRVVVPLLLLLQFVLWPLLGRWSMHGGLLLAQGLLLVLLLGAIRWQRLAAADVLLLNAATAAHIGLAVFGAALAAVALAQLDNMVLALWARVGWEPPVWLAQSALRMHFVQGGEHLPLVLAATVLVPALSEELLFRGYVFSSLHAYRGRRQAVAVSAMLFAIAHLNPWQAPALLLLGLFLGAIALHTHSVYPPLAAHLVINLVACAEANLRAYRGVVLTDPTSAAAVAAAALAGAGALACLRRMGQRAAVVPLESWQEARQRQLGG